MRKSRAQTVIMEEGSKRYLAPLAFNDLDCKKHKKLKADMKHDWVRNKTDSLPRSYEQLMEITGGYKVVCDRPRRKPKRPGVALISTNDQDYGQEGQGGHREQGRHGPGGWGHNHRGSRENKKEEQEAET